MLRRIILSCILLTAALPTVAQICVRHIVAPGYPPVARQARLTGLVRVTVELRLDGTVASAKATGVHKYLQKVSEENVKQWLFCAGDAPPGDTRTTTITYTYRLEGREVYGYEPVPFVVFDLPDNVTITTQPQTVNP